MSRGGMDRESTGAGVRERVILVASALLRCDPVSRDLRNNGADEHDFSAGDLETGLGPVIFDRDEKTTFLLCISRLPVLRTSH